MTPAQIAAYHGTRRRSAPALLAACLLLLAAGGHTAYPAVTVRAASSATQPAADNGLTGTITYLQTDKRQKTSDVNGTTRIDGEDTTIRGTWDVTGTDNNSTTAGQDAGATLTLDYYDHTYNSESSTISLDCGPNHTFITIPTKQSFDQVDKAQLTNVTSSVLVTLPAQGPYNIMVTTEEAPAPLAPTASSGTETRTIFDSTVGDPCAGQAKPTTETAPFEPLVPELSALSGMRDPATPLTLSGKSTSAGPDSNGGVRTTVITWDLSLAPERCPAGYELSSSAWVDRFPGSTTVSDLQPNFQASVRGFLRALKAAGAAVEVTSTYRPLQRSYLMYYAYQIAHDQVNAATVPGMSGVNICWLHREGNGDPDWLGTTFAARAMVTAYHLVAPPALRSKHTTRQAIDMTVRWTGTLQVNAADGRLITISGVPRDGQNRQLWAVGASYGVHKLPSDPVYWSDDGH